MLKIRRLAIASLLPLAMGILTIAPSSAGAETRTYGDCTVYGNSIKGSEVGSETSTTNPGGCGLAYASAYICGFGGSNCFFTPTNSGSVYARSTNGAGGLYGAYHWTANTPQWVTL